MREDIDLRPAGQVQRGAVRQGTFSANRLDADLDTHTVTLTGNARLHIVPRGTR